MIWPQWLIRCPECGEHKGSPTIAEMKATGEQLWHRPENIDGPVPLSCWCDTIPCPRCGKGRARPRGSYHLHELLMRVGRIESDPLETGCPICNPDFNLERAQGDWARPRKEPTIQTHASPPQDPRLGYIWAVMTGKRWFDYLLRERGLPKPMREDYIALFPRIYDLIRLPVQGEHRGILKLLINEEPLELPLAEKFISLAENESLRPGLIVEAIVVARRVSTGKGFLW